MMTSIGRDSLFLDGLLQAIYELVRTQLKIIDMSPLELLVGSVNGAVLKLTSMELKDQILARAWITAGFRSLVFGFR